MCWKQLTTKRKETPLISVKENESHRKAKSQKIVKKDWNPQKFRGHCQFAGRHRDAAQRICIVGKSVIQEISVLIDNGSKFDYHLIMKQ